MSKNNYKPYKTKAILNNIEKVLKEEDITKLSKKAYDFLYIQTGFIAHYNHNGFIDWYERDFNQFLQDLAGLGKWDINRLNDKWSIEEYGKEYCNSKYDITKGIIKLLNQLS